MPVTFDTYKRRAGSSASHGHSFERKMLCVLYLRCLIWFNAKKIKSFKIANNMDHVGVFDDTMCRIVYEENGSEQTKLIFIQTKHSEDPVKHPFADELLMPTKKKSIGKIPPILKYIESFLNIGLILDENELGENVRDFDKAGLSDSKIREKLRNTFNCSHEDIKCVYYTNAAKGKLKYFQKLEHEDFVTKLLDTNPMGGVYKINLENIELSKMFPKIYENRTEIEFNRIQQFLNLFNVYIDQTSYHNLEEIIKMELKNILSDLEADIDLLYSILYEEIKQFFCATYGLFLTEDVNFLSAIYSLLNIQRQTKCEMEKYSNWHSVFSDETLETLFNEINNRKFICIHYRKLEKYKILVKCVQLIKKMRENNTSVLFLYISKKSFEMWEKIRNLYNYKKYNTILLCIDNVSADDVHRVCNHGTQELIMMISENNSANEPSLWKKFSRSGLEQIMDYNVTFHGVHSTLRKILGDINVREFFDNTEHRKFLEYFLSLVLNNEDINIGSKMLHDDSTYVNRRYKKHSKKFKFEATNEKGDMFIIYPKRNISQTMNIHDNTNVLIFETKDDAWNHFHSRMEETRNTHLFFVERNLELLFSIGTMDNILKYKIDKEVMNEEDFQQHVLKNKFTILCDEVGMGKSTTLKQLAHRLKITNTGYWTEYINLKFLDKKLRNIKENLNPLDAVIYLLKLDDVEKMIFQYKAHNDGNVVLLFDCFEEISAESRANFLRLVQDISKTKIKSIVVSTRQNVATELKKSINGFHFSFIGFNYEDIYSYLMKYWSNHVDKKYAERLPEVVQDVVHQAKGMEKILKEIIAVPLQIRMLAETYNEKIVNSLSSAHNLQSLELQTLSLYSLYNNFIHMHIDRCMQEKFGITDENISSYEIVKDALFKTSSGIWEDIACQEIFPGMKMSEVLESDILEQAKLRIGIFVNNDSKSVSFVHRSFAEFLAAKKVSRMIYECKNPVVLEYIYQKVCIDKSFLILRKFMNSCYENERIWEIDLFNRDTLVDIDGDVLATAIKEEHQFVFKVLLQHISRNQDGLKNILNRKYGDRETLLILAAKHCEQVFDDILHSQFFDSASERDSHGRTALHWACIKRKENIVKAYLSKNFMTESLSSIINQTDYELNTPLLLAAEKGQTNVIKTLQNHGASIHTKNYKGVNALICALNGGFIETVKYLIAQGALINETDNDGKTVLMHACINTKESKYVEDCAKYLIEEAGADVNIQDSKGRTALMHLIENNKCNDNLKFLILNGTDIKVVDSNGRNAVTLAAKYGQTETMKILTELGINLANVFDANGDTYFTLCSYAEDLSVLQYFIDKHKPNLDYQNLEGETTLFGAVLHGRMEIIELLISHGASVNICNKEGDTALSAAFGPKLLHTLDDCDGTYVIRTPFSTILKFLIDHGAKINHQNCLGNSALHLALRLDSRIVPLYPIIESIKTLIEHGADIHLKNKDSVTPAMIAHEHQEPGVVSYFKV